MHELRKGPLLNKWIAVLKDSKETDFYNILPTSPEHAADYLTGASPL